MSFFQPNSSSCPIQLNRHLDMISSGALSSILMVALVRAVGVSTKQVCAKALLNLLAGACTDRLISDGVVGAFATLSFVDCKETHVRYAILAILPFEMS